MFKKIIKITLLITILTALCFAAIAALFPTPTFRATLKLWSVTEAAPNKKVDAIFVLGGGAPFRPNATADLWHKNAAKQIYAFNPAPKRSSNLTISFLSRLKVPKEAITLIEPEVDSTFKEAKLAAQIVAENQYKSIIIPTDHFHSRRVRWIFKKHLPSNCEIIITEAPFHYYQYDSWWKHENGRERMRSELIKNIYYRFKY